MMMVMLLLPLLVAWAVPPARLGGAPASPSKNIRSQHLSPPERKKQAIGYLLWRAPASPFSRPMVLLPLLVAWAVPPARLDPALAS